jgi:hypothetical protein
MNEKVKVGQVCGIDLPLANRFLLWAQYAMLGKDRIGVVLDEPLGTNNGTIKGHKCVNTTPLAPKGTISPFTTASRPASSVVLRTP